MLERHARLILAFHLLRVGLVLINQGQLRHRHLVAEQVTQKGEATSLSSLRNLLDKTPKKE